MASYDDKEEIVVMTNNKNQLVTRETQEGFLYSYRQLDTNALEDEVDK